MNILYISQYFPPEACAPAVRVDSFSREWARAGAEVSVLTGFPNHPEGVLHPEYRKLWRRGFMREQRERVKVCRTWLYPSANRGLWGRGANFASFGVSAAMAGSCAAPSEGVVIATSPQILVGVSGWMVGAVRNLPWVFEVRDLWPESLVGVGQTAAGSLLYRSVGHVANFLYRRATHIVVDGEWKRRHLIQKGLEEKRISVMRNGIDEDHCLDPYSDSAREARHALRQELGLREEFVLLYAGTLGMAHGLETVLLAAARLRERGDVAFLMMGEGAEREQLLARSRELRLTNVRFLGKQPREKVPAYILAADACLVPLRRREVFKTAIPSKMFEAMAAARPVILGVEGEAKEILLEAGGGIAVPPDDSEALADAILMLRQHPELARALGTNGRRAVRAKYSCRQQARAYLELLGRLVGTARRRLVSERLQAPETASVDNPEVLTGREL
jgi:glycosyltransferase involved in cell wall biosynthesis